jgi:small conductance mechanosensitive channel
MRWPFHTPPEAVLDKAVTSGLDILLVIVVSTAAWLLVRRTLRAVIAREYPEEAGDRAARIRTVGTLIQSIAGYAIAFVALLTILSHLGVNTTALVTAAGVFSVAVGLGSRAFISDVIGGFFIVLEHQFGVGDLVTLGAGPGVMAADNVEPLLVEAIGIRTSRFRDADGRLVIVGNGSITSVVNHSRGPLRVRADLLLRLETPRREIDRLSGVVSASLDPALWKERPAFVGFLDAPEGKLKARIAGVAVEGRRLEAERELRAALHEAFLPWLAGSTLPAPQIPGPPPEPAPEDFP